MGSSSGAVSAALQSVPAFHGFAIAGQFCYPSNFIYTGPVALVDGRLVAVPLWMPRSQNVDQIVFRVTTLAAATNVRVGFYRGTAEAPSTLLLEAGSVSAATTGDKVVAAAQALAAGYVWVAGVAQGGAPAVQCSFGSPARTAAFDPSPDQFTALRHNAAVPAALPATFTVDPAAPNSAGPLFGVRFA